MLPNNHDKPRWASQQPFGTLPTAPTLNESWLNGQRPHSLQLLGEKSNWNRLSFKVVISSCVGFGGKGHKPNKKTIHVFFGCLLQNPYLNIGGTMKPVRSKTSETLSLNQQNTTTNLRGWMGTKLTGTRIYVVSQLVAALAPNLPQTKKTHIQAPGFLWVNQTDRCLQSIRTPFNKTLI